MDEATIRTTTSRSSSAGCLSAARGCCRVSSSVFVFCCSPSHQDDNFSTHQLKAFYDLEYNSLLCLELAFALAMHATYKSFKRSKEQGKPRRYSDLVMPLAYAICSAIVGTQSVVNAKCLSELLTLTFQGENQMVRVGLKKRRRRAGGGGRGTGGGGAGLDGLFLLHRYMSVSQEESIFSLELRSRVASALPVPALVLIHFGQPQRWPCFALF